MAEHLSRLFSSLATEADLDSLCNLGREEDLYVEFKQKHDRRHGNLEDSDRKNFSKALAGFANADGGVLVFGIKTTKTTDGVDRATQLHAISDHTQFRARLLDSIFNTTQPVIDGIEIETIDSTEGSGYVKCLVPQSVRAPHRAVVADHQYWRRTATGHRRMDHYELEDLFGRRLRPSLSFFLELKSRPDDDPHEELHFLVLNEGRGLGRHLGFFVQPAEAKVEGVQGHGLRNATAVNGCPTITYYDPHHVVHANGIYLFAGHAIIRRAAKGSPLVVMAAWYAEDAETKRASGTVVAGTRLKLG
jgi:hypothetical protein